MQNILVAVGSTRPLKLRAVTEALQSFSATLELGLRFDVAGFDVASGVSHTPSSRAELMSGARNRALALSQLARERGAACQYFVGLEGGLDVIHENGRRIAFLESWAFVSDVAGRQ